MASPYTLRLWAYGPARSIFGSTPLGILRRGYVTTSNLGARTSTSTSTSTSATAVATLGRRTARSSSSSTSSQPSLLFPTAAGLTTGAALASYMHLSSSPFSNPGMTLLRCDSPFSGTAGGAARQIHDRAGSSSTSRSSSTPGLINKRTAKQLSTGSLLGLTAGLAISVFSKPLTVLLGLFIASTQLFQLATGARIPFLEQAELNAARLVGRKVRDASDALDADKWRQNLVFRLSFGLACVLAGGFLDF